MSKSSAATQVADTPVGMRAESLGMWLGLLGVAVFALTLPMTRLATGTLAAPQLSPWFITFGRAALAGCLAIVYLIATRAPRPAKRHWRPLAISALCTTIGWPLCIAFALRTVTASHAAVITALLPLATAAVAALVLRQRAPLSFWLCALAGSALVVAFALWRSHQQGEGFALASADLWLLLGVAAAAVGYVFGAQVTAELGAERVICWVCVLALVYTVPGAIATWPAAPVQWSAWTGFVYLGVFSMWLGFFAWYRGLAIGGALRVSQIQLLQPFLSILAAVPLLGESLDGVTLGFALAVVATVLVGKRLSQPRRGAAPVSA